MRLGGIDVARYGVLVSIKSVRISNDDVRTIFGFVLLIPIGIGVMLWGEAIRAHVQLFLAIWLTLPVVAILIRKLEPFDSKTLRTCRTWFMVIVIGISYYVVIGWDDIRNDIGQRYITGYRYWHEEDEDSEGRPIRVQNYKATNPSGERFLSILAWIRFAVVIVVPMVTYNSFEAAIKKQQLEEEIEEHELRKRFEREEET